MNTPNPSPDAREFADSVFPLVQDMIEADDPQWKSIAEQIMKHAVSDMTGYMLACGLASVVEAFIKTLQETFGVVQPTTEHHPIDAEDARTMMAAAAWLRDHINGQSGFADFIERLEHSPKFAARFYIFILVEVRQLAHEVAYQESARRA